MTGARELHKLIHDLKEKETHLVNLKDKLQEANRILITKVEERTKELKEAEKQLIQAEKMATIGTLAGGIAHEINNPLGAILTNAQMLLRTAKDKDDLESLKIIEQSARRASQITQSLLHYSQRNTVVNVEKINLSDLIDESIHILRNQFRIKGIKIEKRCPKDLTLKINTLAIQQVLTNLMVNAKDAILENKKEGKIIISSEKHKGYILLKVKDNGTGIPKENLKHIFDPFFTTKEVGKGTGLGLAICYKLIAKHGGKIDVETKLGKGTTFIIRFPI